MFLGTIAPGRRLELAAETLALVCRHSWPGNVRELRNALEHAAAVSSGEIILPWHLPRDLREQVAVTRDTASLETALGGWVDELLRTGADYDRIHDRLETLLLRHLLARFEHKPTALARALGMNRVTLRKKCREFFGSGT